MLTHLSIQGLAIIDTLQIDFSNGFNVITGETGAGKSILIRALNLVLGAKASADTVRQGFDQALVAAEFSVGQRHRALILLENMGIPIEEGEGRISILIRRVVSTKGRSQAWINDVSVTTHALRELGGALVDVFGQHENQRLMDAAHHLSYLDAFLSHPEHLRQVRHYFSEVDLRVKDIEAVITGFESRQKNRDYFEYRLAELKEFDPSKEDFDSIKKFNEEASQRGKVTEILNRATRQLESEDGLALGQGAWDLAKTLAELELVFPGHKGLADNATNIAHQIDDLSFELNQLASKESFDEADADAAQARLYGYQELFRKHAVRDIDGLMQEKEKLECELGSLEELAQLLKTKLEELESLARDLKRTATQLTEARKVAAHTLQKRVQEELSELAMRGAQFRVSLTPVERTLPALVLEVISKDLSELWASIRSEIAGVNEFGQERAEFFLASNPGEAFLPLIRTASGGELSRIMLALKKAMAVDAETCVLVFDEIDTGISGRTANVVGKKMSELSESFQVLCISHLPQVAVYADTHFLVAKGAKSRRTEAQIVRLSRGESVREIARLLSGDEVSSLSLANAENLIEKARGKGRAPISVN